MLRLIRAEHGRKGVWRTYQHVKHGRLDIITMHGKRGSADVIHLQRKLGARRRHAEQRQRRQG